MGKTKKLELTYSECINMLVASTNGPGINLPGMDWSFFLALISCDVELMKCNKAIEAAQDAKNIGEGKGKAEAEKLKKSWEEFVKERAELQKKHAKKGETGEPAVSSMGRVEFEDAEAFAKEFESIQKKHQDAINAREEQLKRVSEKLESTVKVTLPTITKEELPEGITQAALAPFAKLLVAQ